MAMIEVNWNPDRRQCRVFGLASLVVFGALGGWAFFRHSIFGFGLAAGAGQVTGLVLCLLGLACGVLALIAPRALRWLYVGLSAVTLPIGLVISNVLVAVLFYAVFTPTALFFRLIGRDPLHRKFEPGTRTYWTPRKPRADIRRYFHQA